MTPGRFLMFVGMNLRASRRRLLLYALMMTAALVFLFTVAIFYERVVMSVDSTLNEAQDMIAWRSFIFRGDIELVKDFPEIAGIQMIDEETDKYEILVTDYRTLYRCIERIDVNALGTVMVNGDNLADLDAIIMVRRIIQIIFVMVFVGTLGTLYVLMHKLFQDRFYEIALCKAVGYNCTHLSLLTGAEVSVLLFVSSIVAFGGGWAMYSIIEANMSGFMTQGIFAYGQREGGSIIRSMGLVALLTALLSLVLMWQTGREIKKTDALAIRNQL